MQIFTFSPKITILLILLVLLPLLLQAKNQVHENDVVQTNSSSARPLWLRRRVNPRPQGCWRRPWICRGDDSPRIKRRCCLDRCVDVLSDVNNCGLCGVRCPFTWQCCRGVCVNTNINPFHCGNCDRRCPFLVFCFYGMCGYDQPFPPKPPHPWPPKPHPPPKPWPKPGPPNPHPPPDSGKAAD